MIAHFIFQNPLSARCRVYDERTCDLGRLLNSTVSLVFITSTPNNHDNFLETDYPRSIVTGPADGTPAGFLRRAGAQRDGGRRP
jgi:hypothetical protein